MIEAIGPVLSRIANSAWTIPTLLAVCAVAASLLGLSLWRQQLARRALARARERFGLEPAGAGPGYLRGRVLPAGRVDRARGRIDRLLTGLDDQGRSFLGRRRGPAGEQLFLYFELGSEEGLRSLYARPEAGGEEAAVAVDWRPRAHELLAGRTHALATRLLHTLALHSQEHGRAAWALHLDGGHVVLLSPGAVRGGELEAHLERALELRRRVLGSVRRAREGRRDQSGPTRPSRALPRVEHIAAR